MSIAVCLTAVSTESNDSFAEAVTRPSTSAVIVATQPDPELHRVLGGLGDMAVRQLRAQPESEHRTAEGAGEDDSADEYGVHDGVTPCGLDATR